MWIDKHGNTCIGIKPKTEQKKEQKIVTKVEPKKEEKNKKGGK